MTEDEVMRLVRAAPARKVLETLAKIPEKDRRAFAKPVGVLFKSWYDSQVSFGKTAPAPPALKDEDALKIALLATATPSEMKARGHFLYPRAITLVEVMQALRPGWLDDWVNRQIEESPFFVGQMVPLWQAGLCRRPDSDAFILGYYAHHRGTALAHDTPEFLHGDVWRFFEVEGGGEFSLAAHDKYSTEALQWSNILLKKAQAGTLPRDRLLDASLSALERDFGQFRAGWYSRFHTALDPDLDEQTARADRYLGLLRSSVPPTVSMALKTLKALDKAGRLEPERLLANLETALQGRHKATVVGALQLLGSAAQRAPDLGPRIALLATGALISEHGDVQKRALDLIEKHGNPGDPALQQALRAHAETLVPSMLHRISELLGEEGDNSAPVDGGAALAPAIAGAIETVHTPEAALALFLEVLESARDPLAIERAFDGLSRFGAALCDRPDNLSPLAKRSRQLLDRGGDVKVRTVLAATGQALCGATSVGEVLKQSLPQDTYESVLPESFAHALLRRADEMLTHIRDGRAVPLLSLPSDTSGQVAPADLVARLNAYHNGGAEPGQTDLELALLRLAPEGRIRALAAFTPRTDGDQCVAWALGGQGRPAGPVALRVAAWAARAPRQRDEGIVAAVGQPLPDAGIPARFTLDVGTRTSGEYTWHDLTLTVEPAASTDGKVYLSSLFHWPQRNRWGGETPCGYTFEDIAWSALVWPGNPEPFCAQAILQLDTDQKLTDHPLLACLEPFFRPGPAPGPMACAMLAYFLASTDKSLTQTTVDAIAAQVAAGGLNSAGFARALRPFLHNPALPTARWTRALSDLSALAPEAAGFVRETISAVLDFPADDAPRDLGGLLELLYELCVAAKTPPDAAAIACLGQLKGGGKTGKFAARLVAMAA